MMCSAFVAAAMVISHGRLHSRTLHRGNVVCEADSPLGATMVQISLMTLTVCRAR